MTRAAKEVKPSFELATSRALNQPRGPWAMLPITAMLNASPNYLCRDPK